MATQAVRGEIVGRERELEALRTFLSGADGASILVFHGEAGSGKTTLWLAGAELAEAEDWLVLRSRPVEAEATLALAGIADLLEDVLDTVLPALPEPQRQALAAALLLEPGEAPGERAVAAAFLTALRVLGERGPVLVAVDDVQWLDSASTGVLLYALRRIRDERIRAVLALRAPPGDDPVSTLRTRLAPSSVEELAVGPLSLGAIHALLRSRLDFSPSRPLLRRIHDASDGNPFFALELGRALRQRGGRLDPGEPLPVPEDLTRLLEHRLANLPADTREALVTAGPPEADRPARHEQPNGARAGRRDAGDPDRGRQDSLHAPAARLGPVRGSERGRAPDAPPPPRRSRRELRGARPPPRARRRWA